jgi:uncharacterized protein YbjT (DUF2867 family)
VRWIGADIATLTTPHAWAAHIEGVDAIVNASGALQDGARDNLRAAQQDAIIALIQACAGKAIRFVQISAPGAKLDARTEFLRTKGVADAAFRASALDWTILKPGLVISANAYGGTSLLRMLAATPFGQPLVLGDARVQIVAASDVAEATLLAVEGGTRCATWSANSASGLALSAPALGSNCRARWAFSSRVALISPVGWAGVHRCEQRRCVYWRTASHATALGGKRQAGAS